jgi:hypothetical protein
MILSWLKRRLRRQKLIEEFTPADWAAVQKLTDKIEREHPDECKAIRAEADAEFERIKRLTMFKSPIIH